jgi:hypothetical protein
MIYNKLNAYDAYESGLKTRLDECGKPVAMPFSIYKLNECHHDFTSTKEELARIGAYARGDKSLKYSFMHCAHWEKHIWAKRVTAHNCFSLGRNLVGVIHGLPGDGVSAAVVQHITSVVNRRIPDLLDLGECARIETKTDWKNVSKLLGTGRCALDDFNDDCIALIDWVMDTLISAEPKTSSGPFKSFAEDRQGICRRAQS